MKRQINNEWSCEYMTPFGCGARDFAKELMLQEMIEGSKLYKELSDICKKQCCYECDESCGYRCGQATAIRRGEVDGEINKKNKKAAKG